MIKKNNNQHNGFVLLLVLLVTSGVMALGLACWYQASLTLDVLTERERYYKNFYDASCALDAGIILVRQNFDLFLDACHKKREKLSLDIRSIFHGIFTQDKKIILTIEHKDTKVQKNKNHNRQDLLVTVCLYDFLDRRREFQACCIVRCLLTKTVGKKIDPQNSQQDDPKKNNTRNGDNGDNREQDRNKKTEQYLVQHFTIGNQL